MLVSLPRELQQAVETELVQCDARRLQHRVKLLSERYRKHEASGRGRFIADPDDARAYAASILPQSFAQISGALSMLPLRVGDWQPRKVLDIGAGPGTTAWAVAAIWPELERLVHVEADPSFLDLGRRLSGSSPTAAVRDAEWREMDVIEEGLPGGRYDLIVMSLVLSEMARGQRRDLLSAAWRRCDGVLLVVEPGTPATFEVVRDARAQLLRSGGHALAPCPHQEDCPIEEGDWCHFSERSERPLFQRRAKEASLPWEDAKFSFTAVSRFEAQAAPWARVLHQPKKQKSLMELDLCTEAGALANERVPKGRKGAYRFAKKLSWGSGIESAGELGEA